MRRGDLHDSPGLVQHDLDVRARTDSRIRDHEDARLTPSAILGMILGEAAVIALTGGAIGCLLAAGLCAMARQAPAFLQAVRQLGVTPLIAALNLSAALLIGLASAFVPALGACRTSIADSLRHTG